MSPIKYERERKKAAERLGVRTSILDRLVGDERAKLGLDEDDGKQGRAISFPEPEPWPSPVDGAALLDEIAAAIGKHVVMSEQSRHVAALWVVHTYLARPLPGVAAAGDLLAGQAMRQDHAARRARAVWCCARCRLRT